ncbi:MASE1 domain-containing protein [Streptomyces roseicoloratus]|uniref:MASE1 domain-containing protein n=1 Tax=Streptomyces roseicoloratus TaxID=2508722 RepID=A0ABY9RPB8_9ACTN|nr:MASE1 domain-containing protein [Streptomyces roseicoloratus]WMX44031.1 MASE1 domain-containing protein [Streptomyces roseicoloratus]
MFVNRQFRPLTDAALISLAVAVCYYAAGRLGLLGRLVVEGVVATPIWPPTGVAVAALLLFGARVWPGIALGSFLVITSLTTPGPTTAVTVVSNTVAPLCAFLLLRRADFRLDMARLRDGLSLIFLGGFGAMLISATAGVGLQVVKGSLDRSEFWAVWLAWWAGDTMGVLLVAPLLLVLAGPSGRFRVRRWKEAAFLGLTTLVLVPLAVLSPMGLLFLVCPLLVWAALRFQLAGSMLCALFASVFATVVATSDHGSFSHLSDVEIMVKLQTFNGSAALTALLLASVITEQRATRRSVRHACEELAEVLEHLAVGEPSPAPPTGPPPEPSESRQAPPGGLRDPCPSASTTDPLNGGCGAHGRVVGPGGGGP